MWREAVSGEGTSGRGKYVPFSWEAKRASYGDGCSEKLDDLCGTGENPKFLRLYFSLSGGDTPSCADEVTASF